MKQILNEVGADFDLVDDPSHDLPPEVVRDYEKSVQAFRSICIDINEVITITRSGGGCNFSDVVNGNIGKERDKFIVSSFEEHVLWLK